jgi:hypothetical protein
MQDLVLAAITSQLTDDRRLTIERADYVDRTLLQPSVVKPAKLFTMDSTVVLKKIWTLRPEKRRAEVRDHALAVDRHGAACPFRDQSGPIPLQQR